MQSVRIATAPETGRGGPLGLPLKSLVFAGVLVVAVLAYFAYVSARPKPSVLADISTVPVQSGSISAVVNSTGQVAPLIQAKLSFQSAGKITDLPVQVGDAVKKGDVLAKLDPTSLQIQVEQAQANYDSAQAKLEAVLAGPRKDDVAAAQAVVDAAKAKLAGMQAGGRSEDLKSAEASLASAQAKLHELEQGSLPSDIAAGKATVDQAQSSLEKAQASLADLVRPSDPLAIQNAQLAVAQAKSTLWSAQANRDGSCNPHNPQYTCDSANAEVAADQTAVQQAQVKLNQIQEGPKPADVAAAKSAVASAQAQLASAQAKLKFLQAGPLPDEVTQANAAVTEAEQTLALQKKPYSQSDIDQQKQVVAQDAAQLALTQRPYTTADIDQAKAAVAQVKAQLDLAKYNLAQTTITAPFNGIVSAVNANVGELETGSGTDPIVALVDPKDLILDVSVDENDIGHVNVGQPANITFNALPNKQFVGKVVSIAPNAAVQSGVATYTVGIAFQQTEGVKPGLTGNADIIYAQHDHTLLVPNRAVRSVGAQHVVSVVDGTKVVQQPVTTGVSNDQFTEILSGLKVGEPVVIPMTSPIVAPFNRGAKG